MSINTFFNLLSTNVIFSIVVIISSCSPKEEEAEVVPDPVACIEASAMEINVGGSVTFTSCSENAVSFPWSAYGTSQVSYTFDTPGDKDVVRILQ